ncbi:hypothetical protein RGUI_3971 [Rhodovulum sp. P5]|uniref:hypothetical protein n=1 Tax=Rhodovulum sp. P5 TaxID=1564506 RepID=UPI0009C24AFF|nr:hypothetical protein [Rhodovulum sp. P5]ARE42112.1 hypothetical protein RGUI_3971 [Rhodovulum sp. P5]
MFLELIATFVAALGAAGLVMGLNMMTGGRLPKWLMPVAAGAAMIAYAVWSEYSWAGRTVAGLPEGVVEVSRVDERIAYKPWTYIVPQTTRLMAADAGGAATRPDAPALRLVNLYLFARWQPARTVPILVDCETAARADATEAALADPAQADWLPLPAGDPLVVAVCTSRE